MSSSSGTPTAGGPTAGPLTAEGLPQESWPAAVYPASGGAVYLGLYQTEGAETHLQLYRLTDQGRTAELLLDEPCQGESLPEQMDSLRFSAFSEVDSVVTFAVIEGDTARFYQRTSASSGLELLQEVTEPGLHTAMALSDGSVVLSAGEGLVRTGGETIALEGNETVIRLLQAGTGIYYVDGASLAVFYADYADWRPYSFLELSKDAYDLDACTDLWVTRNGGRPAADGRAAAADGPGEHRVRPDGTALPAGIPVRPDPAGADPGSPGGDHPAVVSGL